jgi:hypothetical protein
MSSLKDPPVERVTSDIKKHLSPTPHEDAEIAKRRKRKLSAPKIEKQEFDA